jgi:membrane protease YdiL (CAAX protease family)
MIRKFSNGYILVEFSVLFIIVPLLYVLDLIPFHKIIPLVALFIYCAVVLAINRPNNPDRFRAKANWRFILLRFFIISVLIFLWIIWFSSNPLLADFGANRQLFYMVLIYPFSSAFPQEFIFREFFFYRYKPLFKSEMALVGTNILLFSFAHIYFANWTVIIFTLAGGLIFALTYSKTRSLLVVTIEHTLFGLVILSSGLAEQFYKAF